MNFQFGEPNGTQNSSSHLSIALHLIRFEKKEEIVVGVALKKGTLLQWSPFSFQLISYDWI